MLNLPHKQFINDRYIISERRWPIAHVGTNFIYVVYLDYSNKLIEKKYLRLVHAKHEICVVMHKTYGEPTPAEVLEIKSKLWIQIHHVKTKHIYDKLLKNLKKAQYR